MSFEVTVAGSVSPLSEKPALPPQLAIEATRHAVGSADCLNVAERFELTTAGKMPVAVAEIQTIVGHLTPRLRSNSLREREESGMTLSSFLTSVNAFEIASIA